VATAATILIVAGRERLESLEMMSFNSEPSGSHLGRDACN